MNVYLAAELRAATGMGSAVFSPSTPWMTADMEAGEPAARTIFAVATSSTARTLSDTKPGQAGPPGITMMAHRIKSEAIAAAMLTRRLDTKTSMACLLSVG